MAKFKDKVALIVGANSGIGRAAALAFAAEGARVVVAARRKDELDALVAEIKARGGAAGAVVADVSKSADVERMVAHAMTTFGALQFAVNNAGVEGTLGGVIDLPETEFDRVMAINLKGVFLSMKHEASAMLKTGGGGAIINVGSVNSFLGFAGGSAYVASKHALVGLTTSASAELAPHGVRVNIVCPGVIDTPMHQRIRKVVGDALFDDAILSRVHLRRAGRPEEIARTILFLCSDEASYITGTTLTPDGGLAMTL